MKLRQRIRIFIARIIVKILSPVNRIYLRSKSIMLDHDWYIRAQAQKDMNDYLESVGGEKTVDQMIEENLIPGNPIPLRFSGTIPPSAADLEVNKLKLRKKRKQ